MEESDARLSFGMLSCHTGRAAEHLTRAAGPGTRHGSEGAPARGLLCTGPGPSPTTAPGRWRAPCEPCLRSWAPGLCGVPVLGSCPASQEIVSCSETVCGLF